LAAYILFCRFYVVLLYFSLYIGIPAVFPGTEILHRKDYTFYRSYGLPFTPLRFLKLAGSTSLILLYTFFSNDFNSSRPTTVMSSPTNQMNTSAHVAQSNYSPVDAINRHDFGVQKNRKQASTGGGRAWSEDEVRIQILRCVLVLG
jgi:hypothetical protein